MTPKMKEDICAQILGASRPLFLSARISEVCQEKGTQKQLEFSKWGGIFTDDQMAAAMIDRLVHHGHLTIYAM